MELSQIRDQIRHKKSFLCVGLDPDRERIPKFLLKEKDPVFAFNKAIIEATSTYAVAYKPNLAFYEALGLKGWQSLKYTIDYLNSDFPEMFTIADAKRGDIGNTSRMYAKAFFQDLGFDAITVAPYMGKDSVEPFLEYPNKFTILLALTSNSGASDFQHDKKGPELFEKVLQVSQKWKHSERLMYVVGATQTKFLTRIREIVPNSFLLIPGVGAQGGDIEAVCRAALGAESNILINASRSIIYASDGLDFEKAAAEEAARMASEMAAFL